jgi:hypothetical protein
MLSGVVVLRCRLAGRHVNSHQTSGGYAMNDEHIELSDRTLVRVVRVASMDALDLAYIRAVPTDDARRIVSAYQQAEKMAADLRSALVQAGVITDNRAVDALLNDAGNVVLRVELSPEGMARFERILDRMAAPSEDGTNGQVA